MLDKMPSFLGEHSSSRGNTPGQHGRRRSPVTFDGAWARDAYVMAALLTIVARFGEHALGRGATLLLASCAAALVVFAFLYSLIHAIVRPQTPKMWRGNVIQYPTGRPYGRLLLWWRRIGRGGGSRRW